jgi:hypothetical protein
MDFALLAPATALVLLIAILAVLAERSLKRQRNSKLRRGREEENAAAGLQEKFPRW